MTDGKEQKLLGRKTVAQGADSTLLHHALAKLPPVELTEEQKAHYEKRMMRLEEAVARLKGKTGGKKFLT